MIKLTEILDEILTEKLCKKGRAYYNRRRAAGEKPSAYLSGRAVKVCKGLMEGDEETVECAKCGWRWDLENGGENPYLCHKCDYDNSYKYNDNLDEGFAHQMSNSDFDKMTNILNNKSKADQIHSLLIQMFPNQKELLDYNYKNDSYAEFKRFIHGIENYSLEGPINIPYTDLKLDPEVYAERDRKYNDYVEGKINKYFRDTNLDPRKVDLSKVPPITVDENGEVMDGNHRAFLAIKQQKPLKGYRMVAKQNSHPNVAKIKALLNTIDESLRDWFKKEDWVRIDTAGNITGPCGTMKKGNKTTRCLPRAKANSLTKAERAATSKKKAASDKQFVPNTKKAKVRLNK
jgi:hypothetical protein